MNNLLRYDKEQKFICYDGESESLNLYYNRPWQLSYLLIKGDNIIEEHDYYIWWEDLQISEGAARITRFNYEEYKRRAIKPEKAYEHFESILYNNNYINFGHNILGFDIFLFNNLRRALGKSPDWSYLERLYDTNSLAKAIKFPNPPPIDENRLLWQLKLSNQYIKGIKTNLATMGRELEVSFDENTLHDGLKDVYLNAGVFNKMKWKLEI